MKSPNALLPFDHAVTSKHTTLAISDNHPTCSCFLLLWDGQLTFPQALPNSIMEESDQDSDLSSSPHWLKMNRVHGETSEQKEGKKKQWWEEIITQFYLLRLYAKDDSSQEQFPFLYEKIPPIVLNNVAQSKTQRLTANILILNEGVTRLQQAESLGSNSLPLWNYLIKPLTAWAK